MVYAYAYIYIYIWYIRSYVDIFTFVRETRLVCRTKGKPYTNRVRYLIDYKLSGTVSLTQLG